MVGKQLNHTTKTEWHATSKHDMGKLAFLWFLESQAHQALLRLLVAILQEPKVMCDTYLSSKLVRLYCTGIKIS